MTATLALALFAAFAISFDVLDTERASIKRGFKTVTFIVTHVLM